MKTGLLCNECVYELDLAQVKKLDFTSGII